MTAASYIVDPVGILTIDQIREESWSLADLGKLGLIDPDEPRPLINWLARRGLLPNTRSCGNCGNDMLLYNMEKCIDKCHWRCRPCNTGASIRKDTIFSGSSLHLCKISTILYCWTKELSYEEIEKQAHLGPTSSLLVRWAKIFRVICKGWLSNRQQGIGGMDEQGNSIIVEVDESYLFRRKYNRGRLRNGCWIFGAIERDSGHCYVQIVQNRSAATLLPLIQSCILPGSHIMSDGWRGYIDLNLIRRGIYVHDVVEHVHNFVDPDDDNIHTQNIESLWSRLKRKIRHIYGTSREQLPSHLDEFMWRSYNRHPNVFSNFVITLKLHYGF